MISAKQISDNNVLFAFDSPTIYPYLIIVFTNNYTNETKTAVFSNLSYADGKYRLNIKTVASIYEDLANGSIYLEQVGSWDISIYGTVTSGNLDIETGIFLSDDELIVYLNHEYNSDVDEYSDQFFGGIEKVIQKIIIETPVWGDIEGDINDQVDLKNALDNKQDILPDAVEYTPDDFVNGLLTIDVTAVRFALVIKNNVVTIPGISFDDQVTPTKMFIDLIEQPTSNVIVKLI